MISIHCEGLVWPWIPPLSLIRLNALFDAKLHLVPKLFGGARERRGDSKQNLIIGPPADGGDALW